MRLIIVFGNILTWKVLVAGTIRDEQGVKERERERERWWESYEQNEREREREREIVMNRMRLIIVFGNVLTWIVLLVGTIRDEQGVKERERERDDERVMNKMRERERERERERL